MLAPLFFFSAIMGSVMLFAQFMLGAFDFDGGHHDVIAHGHGGHDHDGQAKGGTLNLTSLRALSAAAALFGFGGGLANSLGAPAFVSLAVGGLAGFTAAYGTAYAINKLTCFESVGNLRLSDAAGKTATVYSTVPCPDQYPFRGKIQVSVNGELVEMLAENLTYEILPPGMRVRVDGVVGNIALVSPVLSTSK